jgi:hypothetical protein
MKRLAVVMILAALGAAPASGQTTGSGSDLLARGERAYRALEYDSAAAWLRRGLAAPGLPDSLRLRGLVYLGATELFRGYEDAAMAAFAEAVRTDRAYAPDSLVFPPRVTSAFEQARRATPPPVLVATPPPVSEPVSPRPAPVPNIAPHERPSVAEAVSRDQEWALSGAVGMGWLGKDSAGLSGAWRGPVASGAGSIAVGWFTLAAGLVEGRLIAAPAGPGRLDLVEGWALVGARPLSWLEISAGPEVRALVSDSASRRVSSWRIAAGVRGPSTPGGMSSYLEVWRSLAVGGDAQRGRWQGGEAGLTVPLGTPLRLRIGYRVDDIAEGSRRETLKALTMTLDLARKGPPP